MELAGGDETGGRGDRRIRIGLLLNFFRLVARGQFAANVLTYRSFVNIAIIARRFPNQSETFVRDHALGLARRGHQVTIISRRPGEGVTEDELSELEGEEVQIEYTGGGRRGLLRKAYKLCGLILCRPSRVLWLFSPKLAENVPAAFTQPILRRVRPDVVHVHYGTSARALHSIGIDFPLVVTWHGYDANRMPHKWGDDAYESLFRSASRHTVGSTFMRDRLLSLGANEEKLSLIPMGVDLMRFSYGERAENPDGPLRIISVGRLVEEKGHTYLIQAVSELLDEGLELELKIIGDGKLWKKLCAQVGSVHRTEAIQLMGGMPAGEVIARLHQSDLFCLTGVIAKNGGEEGQGLVFAEAQATGLPVIGSSVGGVPESLVEGETGILTLPGDVGSIKRAIRFFIENPEKIQEFGRRARAFAEEKFSRDRMLNKFEELYESVRDRAL